MKAPIRRIFYFKNTKKQKLHYMKTIITIAKKIDAVLSKWFENYIYRVSKTLYPKPFLDDDDEDDDEPILFI